MFDDDIQVGNLTMKLRPLTAYPAYNLLPDTHPAKAGKTVNLFAWDCGTRRGSPARPPNRYPVGIDVDFIEFTEPAPALRKLKTRAKIGNFLLATNLSPRDFGARIAQSFPTQFFGLNIPALIRRFGRDYSFTVKIKITYAYMVAKAQLTPQQRRIPLFQDVAEHYLLIGIPVSHQLIIDFTGTCGGARPRRDIVREFPATMTDQARDLALAYVSFLILRQLVPWFWGGLLTFEEDGPGSAEPPSENGGLGEPMDYDALEDDMLAAMPEEQRVEIVKAMEIDDLSTMIKAAEALDPAEIEHEWGDED